MMREFRGHVLSRIKFKDKKNNSAFLKIQESKGELSDKRSYDTTSSGPWLPRAKNTRVCCSERDIQLPPRSPVTVERML